MKNILYLVLFFVSFTAFSQQKAIEITNIKTGKVIVFEENQRIKIRTKDGKKYIGNLKFSDSLSFTINNQSIKMDSLKSIKSQPKVLGTVKTVVLITGLTVVGASIIAASAGSDSAFLVLVIGTGVTIGAGVLEGLNANYSDYKWKFKIVEK
jgi:small nuclear ribonucleoprotein (snRNP)-like protein